MTLRQTVDKIHSYILLRYFTSGTVGGITLLASLYIFHGILGIWYLGASMIAFVLSVVVSFTMQKFWTFSDRERRGMHRQFIFFLSIAIINLGVDTALMYFFVGRLGVQYLIGQVMTALIVASWSFFIYRHIIFKNPQGQVVSIPNLTSRS